jgi:flagellar basal body P-ring formation protein FlgA
MVSFVITIMAFILSSPGSAEVDRLVRYAVEESVRGRLQLPQDDVAIEFRSVPTVPWIDGMAIRVDVEQTPRLLGNVSLPLEVESNGVVVRRTMVSIKVRVFGERLVALHTLQRHDELSEGDSELRRMEITGLPQDGLESLEKTQGTRASRMIREGSVITESALEPVPLVRANRPVTIVARVGNVTVSLRGIAKEDGCKGDRILVEKADSRERLKVQVVGASTVAYMVE